MSRVSKLKLYTDHLNDAVGPSLSSAVPDTVVEEMARAFLFRIDEPATDYTVYLQKFRLQAELACVADTARQRVKCRSAGRPRLDVDRMLIMSVALYDARRGNDGTLLNGKHASRIAAKRLGATPRQVRHAEEQLRARWLRAAALWGLPRDTTAVVLARALMYVQWLMSDVGGRPRSPMLPDETPKNPHLRTGLLDDTYLSACALLVRVVLRAFDPPSSASPPDPDGGEQESNPQATAA